MENDFNGEFFVVFLRTADTDQLKRNGTLRINGRKTLSIQWTHDAFWKNKGHWNTLKSKRARSLMHAPDFEAPDNMMNSLNDDCLRHILEECVSDAVGLYELAKVNTRFQYLARKIFETKYRQHPWFYRTLTFWQPLSIIEDFYRIFGKSIIALDFGQRYNSDIINGIIETYCPRLESVKCELSEQPSCKEVQILAQRVKQLHLKWHRLDPLDLTGTFDESPNLELLSIYNCDAKLLLPRTKIPKLIDLRLSNAEFGNSVMIKGFFKQNAQLERLKLHNICWSIGVEQILTFLTNLESLCIECTWSQFRCGDFNCFGQLKCLTELRIILDANDTQRVLNAITVNDIELEVLRFQVYPDNTDVENIVCNMNSLTCLEIECILSDHELRRYVQELPELRELKVCFITTTKAVQLLRYAKDDLVKVTFTITYDSTEVENMDKKLEDIWTTAQRREIILNVVLLYNLNESEIPVSFRTRKMDFH